MALEKIEQSVLSTAAQEAERILSEARESARQRVEAERESAVRDGERRYQAGVRAIDEEIARRLLQAKGLASKTLLEDRNAVLKRVFGIARQTVLGWPAEQYALVMQQDLTRVAGSLGGRVRIHPDDKNVFARVMSAVNSGRPANAQLALDESEPLPIRGGFVFVADRFEVDRTLDTVLDEIERELSPGIAAKLFSGATV
ncbi:MAG: hypothetical protein AMXMBFR84_08700 [Candidatus Hydrogenedentota bacterium]